MMWCECVVWMYEGRGVDIILPTFEQTPVNGAPSLRSELNICSVLLQETTSPLVLRTASYGGTRPAYKEHSTRPFVASTLAHRAVYYLENLGYSWTSWMWNSDVLQKRRMVWLAGFPLIVSTALSSLLSLSKSITSYRGPDWTTANLQRL
jgi:hypothetical protein